MDEKVLYTKVSEIIEAHKAGRMMFISKSGFEDSVIRYAEEDDTILLSIDDLFR